MLTQISPTVRRDQGKVSLPSFTLLLLLVEPLWVSVAVAGVYLSVIRSWPASVSWLCLAFAFSPFLIRLIKYGHPSRRTSFDIPIIVFLGGIIVGMAVSEHFDISLGAFQTFLAAMALYYSIVNYSKPSWLINMGLPLAVVGAIIASVFAVRWYSSGSNVPHGLIIVLVIIATIVLCITIFNGRTAVRVLGGLFGLMLLAITIFFTHVSFYNFFTLESIEGRMRIWLDVISPIEGSSLWAGLGLGCWPLTDTAPFGHVHNTYLELYINTGVVGLLALICFMVVGAKLAMDIINSPRNNLRYGFGIGVILAALFVLLVGFLESAPFGFGIFYGEEAIYHYILSPIPLVLAGSLIVARRLLREDLP